MSELATEYRTTEQEKKWQDHWQQGNFYKWNNNASKEDSFVIDTPPPTVSGLLHMGHVFSYTQADFIARYMRMKGKEVFYPMGFDDNGLPTERLVEKIKGIRATNMSREEFIEICKEVVKEAEEEFRNLFKSIALSVDWSQEYQTISPHSRAISQLSFLDLYNKNHAYRKLEPCLWDPIDQTALAQADIVDQELKSTMNYVVFQGEQGEELIIATTRPELIPACVAIFCHPEDVRYKHLIGKSGFTPLFGVKLPIIADENVDMEKGSGLVMCSTFGDIMDITWWKLHQLPLRIILDKAGRLGNFEQLGKSEDWHSKDPDKAHEFLSQLQGLKVKEARNKIIELLKNNNLLKEQVEISHAVKCAERSGAPLEILVTPQWFIKILDKKQQFLDKSAECNWYPPYMKTRLDNWINGLNWDWCISRQRYFGVPFPVWYSKRPGEEGKILIADKADLPVNPLTDLPRGYKKEEVEPDIDVMDTWATSSVSPQLSSHGINQSHYLDLKRHNQLFPADLRPQAHEIIRTWAFYTIVKACLHEESIPWKNLMISGWCLAADKTKMSKSKGNVITPVSLIQEKGSDIVRYWASTSRLGADTAYSEEVFKIGKKLLNKIWNASKFASIHFKKLEQEPTTAIEQASNKMISNAIDLWILTRLKRTIEKVTSELEKFEYCEARIAVEDFFWRDFCDNYLEIVKVRAYDETGQDKAGQLSAAVTIYHCLETLLRLLAPFIPHMTEEIYSSLFAKKHKSFGNSIHSKNTWPSREQYPFSEEAEQAGINCVEILNVVRKVKAEKNISLKTTINKLSIITARENNKSIDSIAKDLANVANASELEITTQINNDLTYYETENGMFKINIVM